ncbi:GerAB/ArcD/ProY family transporter [Halalkalibacter alkaliphilus]|uniref:Spore germination protein n=1 Tax=Halalkalibacter alkaliphilus TaxID=2917993 RepID=A0A9X2CT04_9BACI|nr:GerAB/ArcD/ProY family transporter [Halalkalibacter alkaliphilus]MCL7747702.1 spore germination protein [Halalkalibacter alkaliphilus]
MINQDHYRISPLEMSLTLISMLLAIGVLTLPRTLAETMETGDGWIAVLVSGSLVMVFVYLIVRLQKHFPGQTLLEFIGERGFGKWVARLLAILFALYFIPFLAYEARILAVVVRMYLLDRTPMEITLAIILLTTTYAVTKGVQGIVHLNLMFIPFIILIYLVLIAFNIENMDIVELRPVLPLGILPLLPALEPTLFSFLGIELLFFWLTYMKSSNLRALPLNMGILFVTILYFLIVVVSYTAMSVNSVKKLVFPTVTLAKEVEIVEGLIERFEPLMIVIWIMAIFNTMAIIHLLAVQVIKKEILNTKKGMWIPGVVTFLAYIVAFIPNSIQEVFKLGDLVSYTGALLIVLSLIIGFLTVWIRTKKNKNQQQAKEIAK